MKLKEYLKKKDLTRKQFGKMLDIHANTVNRYIRGEMIPPYAIKLAIEYVTMREVAADDWD